MLKQIARNLQNWISSITWRGTLNAMCALLMLILFACFFDWLVLNWLSGCCEGGICIPEWLYPSCQAHEVHHAE